MTEKQKIAQCDWVDNSICNLIKELSPASEMINWDIAVITEIRLILQNLYVNELELCDEEEFYPSLDE
ncbi:MAG: hypothetical protein LBC80_04950 [Treponema sp.]|jgi:hypothetical protein|nr:hypothetical protein [Treponema sp.]